MDTEKKGTNNEKMPMYSGEDVFLVSLVVKEVTKNVYNDKDLLENVNGKVDGSDADTYYYKLVLGDEASLLGLEADPIWVSENVLNWLFDNNLSTVLSENEG